MAKPVAARDAKRIVSIHEKINKQIIGTTDLSERYKEDIKIATEKLITDEVLNILKNVSVSELNREKNGFKIKLLLENNYNTMADLYLASVYNIASINGISEDSARSIKKATKDFIDQAQKEVKIKLSVDNKNTLASNLVSAIYKYKSSIPLIENCRKIKFDNYDKIQFLIEDLKPAMNDFRWFFTSKTSKEKAVEAYNKLNELANEDYGKSANETLFSLDSIKRASSIDAWKDFLNDSVSYFTVLEDVNPGVLGNDDSIYGLSEDLARKINDECIFPDGLLCTLRRYQEWGVKYILHQEKVLLGDEMGLGKTIQAIASMVSLKNTGATHFVVVCPASVVTNWCREIQKHSLLSVIKVHGSGRNLALNDWIKNGGVAVTTYETTGVFKLDDGFKFTLLVVDEAHYIKNPGANRTINVNKLCSHTDRLLFMTGTALENKVDEMITLIGFLQPNIASQVRNISFMASAPQFREKIAPVYYRRKRNDVLTELPDLIESKEWCSMSPDEERLYEETVMSKSYMNIRRVSWNLEDINNSCKAQRLKEIIDEAKSEDRKIIVFSFFLDTIRKIVDLLGEICLNPINGSISPQRRQEIIDEFDKAPSGTVLVAQIQSGGTGLNIQSASVVVICEPQFKPSIENQAISRAYRMGQTRNVLVYRLLCEGTVDEKITAMLEEKQALFNAFADKSVAADKNLELDDTTFGNIIEEEIEKINAKRKAQEDCK